MSIFTALEGVPPQKTAGGCGDDGAGSAGTGAGGTAPNVGCGGNVGGFTFRNQGVSATGVNIVKTNPNSARFGSRAGNCLLLTVTGSCIGILVLCGVMVVREYTASKDYTGATCRIVNITYVRHDVACMFCASTEKGKKEGAGVCTRSSFPCVNIKVSYDVGGDSFEGQLHTGSLQARGSNAQCSISICMKRPKDNKAAVEKYANEWWSRKVTPFKCFYDTTDYQRVIESKRYTKTEVIHCMLWPSIIIVICGAIFLRMEMRRREVTFCHGAGKSRSDGSTYGEVVGDKGHGKYSEDREGKLDAHCRLIDNCGASYTSAGGDERKQNSRRKEAAKSNATTAANGSERANRHRHQTQPHRHPPAKQHMSGNDDSTEKSTKQMVLPLVEKNSAKGPERGEGQKGLETPV